MATLKTDYVNDVLNTDVNEERTYNLVDANGNIIYEGVRIRETTALSTVGDEYGALEINEQNAEINGINIDIGDTDISAIGSTIKGAIKNSDSKTFKYVSTPTNIANFVQNTAIDVNTIVICHFRDTNNVLGLGSTWVKGYLQYQNLYNTQYSVSGEGIFYTSGGIPYYVRIEGTNSFTVTTTSLTAGVNNITAVAVTKQFTVSSTNAFTVTFSPSIPSGYTALGVVGANSGDIALAIIDYGMDNSNNLSYRMSLAPLWSHNGTYTARLRILCAKISS